MQLRCHARVLQLAVIFGADVVSFGAKNVSFGMPVASTLVSLGPPSDSGALGGTRREYPFSTKTRFGAGLP